MTIFYKFLLSDAQSIDRRIFLRSFLRGQKLTRKSWLPDEFEHSSYDLEYITIDQTDVRTHHHFERRLAGNVTMFDEAEQGSPTTVAVVSIVLFIFIISLFFLLSCFMWCCSSSGSYGDEECDDETQMTPKERVEYLHKVLQTKKYVLESVENVSCKMMTSPAVESTIVLKNHTCSDISVPSSEPVLDITSVLVSSFVDDSKRQCAICLENFLEGDLITTSSINLECKHQFHQPCIMEWCMKQSDCPCCRRDLLFLYDTATVAMDNIDSSRTDFTRSIPDFPEE